MGHKPFHERVSVNSVGPDADHRRPKHSKPTKGPRFIPANEMSFAGHIDKIRIETEVGPPPDEDRVKELRELYAADGYQGIEKRYAGDKISERAVTEPLNEERLNELLDQVHREG